jgi:integrase
MPLFRDGKRDSLVTLKFYRLLHRKKLYVSGLSFYRLRHTFRTIADGALDQAAIAYVMGHVDPTMARVYRHAIADARLEVVARRVRDWLYGEVQS